MNRRFGGCEGQIRYHGVPYNYKATIIEGRHAPHVGADSPRYMEPGRRSVVAYYELFDDDGRDEPDLFMDSEKDVIRELIREDHEAQRVAERLMAEGVLV